ncbi:MAG: hypothetical protein JOZ22_07605 [Acidobacteriia bacterium]|nr:hypothetical protein [Terriglobia bacterium]
MYEEAIVQALGGRPSAALESLGRALQNGYAWKEVAVDPELKSLRAQPQFQTLAQKYSGVPQNKPAL